MQSANLRSSQKNILRYQRGKMGIAAVPGSGKTYTLSLLAAELIARGVLQEGQEVLVVTLVNSAVDNFSRRVGEFVTQKTLLPSVGYRVRTLHGLAHDIVRERPDLAGLDSNFQILDERAGEAILDEVARLWLEANPEALEGFLDPTLEGERLGWVRREKLPELVKEVALEFIRTAKDSELTPEALRQRLGELPVPLPLAEIGLALYGDYQRALAYRAAVDFDDLIRLALRVLHSDERFLERLRYRWPYILEDEAQDSSRLQQEILGLLAGPGGNWVRVGDPNQAIYETFTTADPKFLRSFLEQPEVWRQELPESGRSSPSVITLANYLVQWVQQEHPQEEVRAALQAPPWIEPTASGDPQPNPPDYPEGVRLVGKKYTPQEEIQAVADSLERWLGEHVDQTVAVLAPRNQRAFEVVDELKRRGIPYEDSLLRSSSATRQTAGALGNLLRYLSDPGSASKLATAFRVWRQRTLTQAGDESQLEQRRSERGAEWLRKLSHVEDYLWPGPERDWLDELEAVEVDGAIRDALQDFRQQVRRWQGAVLLPVDQAVLAMAQDLFKDAAELALSHKLALLLRQAGQANPSWRLPELTEELAVIARNERRFLGFSQDDSGFDPDRHKGTVVVATMHKAKGLEWDKVYLMSVNNYDFPSGDEYDEYIAEKWYLRDHLNLPAEFLAQLEAASSTSEYEWYREGVATRQRRQDYARERLRLLYVGLTRAKRELVVTWNTGRRGELLPAIPLEALRAFWTQHRSAT